MSLWGETIRKIIFALAMALAFFAVPAMAGACGSDEVLGQGLYETADTAFTIPTKVDVNFKELEVGNDNANAWRSAIAENDLEIKNNQDSGDTDCCAPVGGGCNDCGNKVNIENVLVGDRNANAWGAFPPVPGVVTKAKNKVKIVINQC